MTEELRPVGWGELEVFEVFIESQPDRTRVATSAARVRMDGVFITNLS